MAFCVSQSDFARYYPHDNSAVKVLDVFEDHSVWNINSAILFFQNDKWPARIPDVEVRQWIEDCFYERNVPINENLKIYGKKTKNGKNLTPRSLF